MVKKNLKTVDFSATFKKNYHDYGADVIKDRALPDVRDGLKPVHRAIMTEMLFSHNTSKNKTVKVARITGAVIGNWHPHGDTAVTDALAGMAVPWKNSMPPIEIHGNRGSVFGDTHAAARYIEARLTPTGDAYGRRLKEGIVEYEPNFDETRRMPKILPAGLPYLLINGGEGIAVGFASSIPTHNPIEAINAFIAYTKKPKISVEELLEIMPGPDFYTQGEIINKDELAEIYETGIGRIRIRGRIRYDKKSNSLHVYEIPATAAGTMDKLIDEMVTATMETVDSKGKKHAPKIAGVTKVVDHSGKEGIDISISLKRGVDPEHVKKALFAKTKLEATMKFDFSALNNQKLKRYTLRQYFKEYLAFQHQTVTNEFSLEKQSLEDRKEILDGLLIMQDVVDAVVDSARHSNGKQELQRVLQTGEVLPDTQKSLHKIIKTFSFTERQAEHIANLPIYKINKVDYQALVDEKAQIQEKIEYANSIMNDVTKRKNLIIKRHKEELKNLKSDEFNRKTEIINDNPSTVSKLEIPESPLYVAVDKYQYVRIEEKNFDGASETTNKNRLGFFDSTGICWNLHLENEKPTTGNGTLVNQLINQQVEIVGWSNAINSTDEALGLFIFNDGNVKLTDMRKFMTKSRSTKVASGKSDVPLVKYLDVPKDALGIEIGDKTFRLEDFSVNGVGGHGKHMLTSPIDATVTFITDPTQLPEKAKTSSKASSEAFDGILNFAKNGEATFDWETNEPSTSDEFVFSINYQDLLKTKLIFVHTDGTAKFVEGKDFKVSTHRSKIQADKKDKEILFVTLPVEKLLGNYTDGTQKVIETSLLSTQGKTGGGVRAFYTTKHVLQQVLDGNDSTVAPTSLASQPK